MVVTGDDHLQGQKKVSGGSRLIDGLAPMRSKQPIYKLRRMTLLCLVSVSRCVPCVSNVYERHGLPAQAGRHRLEGTTKQPQWGQGA